jgi:uncharacterized protein YggE
MKIYALLFACLLAHLYCAPTAIAQDANATANVVKATGTGKVTIEAGVAQVELGVQVDAPNASLAQAQVAQTAQNIVTTLQNLNVSKLQTSSITLTQINFPSPSPSPIPVDATTSNTSSSGQETTFRASNTVSFEIAAGRAGEAIDAAVGAGANTISSVSLVPSDDAVTAAQQQATRLAVANAIAYGRLLLSELGCQAVGVGAVTLSPLFAPASSSVNTAGLSADSATTPVLSGEVDITATVEVNLLQSCPGSAIDAINNASTNTTTA